VFAPRFHRNISVESEPVSPTMPPDSQLMNATAMHPRKPQPARFKILQIGIGGLRDKSVPQFPINEALYLDQSIVEIDLNGKRTAE
jgi:hypothetical protein